MYCVNVFQALYFLCDCESVVCRSFFVEMCTVSEVFLILVEGFIREMVYEGNVIPPT